MTRSKIISGSLSRRTFTAAAAGTVSAAVMGRRVYAFESADVIIIGAGLAGLNAALNLESEGLSVIVLEADDYVGGRTKTYDLPIGPTNAGGQTIGPYYARVRDVADRLGISLIPNPRRIPMGNYVNGALVSSADWPNAEANKTVGPERNVQPGSLEFFYLAGNNPLPDVESWTEAEQAQFDVPLETFLRNNGASDEALRLINQSINVFDLSSGSALAYLRDIKRLQWGMGDGENNSRTTYGGSTDDPGLTFNEVAGGTQRLPEAMRAAMKGPVHLNKTVRSIDMTGSDVEVRTIGGERFVGKYAISAVPFTALRNVDVYPNFTGTQFDAIRQSAHGNTLRVFMEFSSPFWDDIGDPGLYTDTAIERVFARTNEEDEIFGLDCWVNGNSAYRLDQLPEEEVGQFVVDTLARIRPSTKGKLKVAQIHSWAKHSPSGCCRHVYNAGQVGLWAGVMATPHERLHLAGEQTRSIENGMEAAAESGERAAFEIMERAL